jgi:hypothetical protein
MIYSKYGRRASTERICDTLLYMAFECLFGKFKRTGFADQQKENNW